MYVCSCTADSPSAQAEVGELREDIAPSWLRPALSVEATAERYVRPHLRQVSGGGRAGQHEVQPFYRTLSIVNIPPA